MKTFIVKNSKYPIGNEIYSKESFDLVNVSNETDRYIVEPGAFKLGEVLDEDEFTLERRVYTDGVSKVEGVFAVRKAKLNEYTLLVTIQAKVRSKFNNVCNVIDEFGSNCDYNLPSTDNVHVVNTEWIDTERTF